MFCSGAWEWLVVRITRIHFLGRLEVAREFTTYRIFIAELNREVEMVVPLPKCFGIQANIELS